MQMRKRYFFWGGTLAVFALTSSFALAQGHGNGHNKHGDDDDASVYTFNDHDRDAMRAWYHGHRDSLPPGLAKKDRLPPGLEKQLVERGTLPPACRNASSLCRWN